MSVTIKCCNCDRLFFDIGALSCPHCNFPLFKKEKEKKLLSFDLWDKIKAIFNKE